MELDLNTVNKRILELRYSGTPYKVIPSLINDPRITRQYVRSLLISHNLLDPNNTHGGYRSGSGKGVRYRIDGNVLDSYGEAIYYLYNKLKGIIVSKNTKEYLVLPNGRRYYPDFIKGTELIEIKSLTSYDLWGWNKYKVDNAGMKITIISKDQLREMEDQVLKEISKDEINSYKY